VDALPGMLGLSAKDGGQTRETADRLGRGALPAPNPYEVSLCQETHYPLRADFVIFSAFSVPV
jgi:hypothetical protein